MRLYKYPADPPKHSQNGTRRMIETSVYSGSGAYVADDSISAYGLMRYDAVYHRYR